MVDHNHWAGHSQIDQTQRKSLLDNPLWSGGKCFISKWDRAAEDAPRCALRYQDLARLAHVSIFTLKRVLKTLAWCGRVHVEWQTKRVFLFTVHLRPLSPSPAFDHGRSPNSPTTSLKKTARSSSRANDPCPRKTKRHWTTKPMVIPSSLISCSSVERLVPIGNTSTTPCSLTARYPSILTAHSCPLSIMSDNPSLW